MLYARPVAECVDLEEWALVIIVFWHCPFFATVLCYCYCCFVCVFVIVVVLFVCCF